MAARLANVTNFIRQSGQKFLESPQNTVHSNKIKRWLYLYPQMSVGVVLGTLGLVIPMFTYMYDSSKESDLLGQSGRLQHWEQRSAEDNVQWKHAVLESIHKIKDENLRSQAEEILKTHPRFNPQQ